jgi:acetyltransferase-like isoleucine patch superfamily enzyme
MQQGAGAMMGEERPHAASAEPKIAEQAFIGDAVTIGRNVVIGHFAVIHDGTVIGDHVVIHDGAVIGKAPMKARNSATTKAGGGLPPAVIKEGCTIGTGAVIYRGACLEKDVFVADLATVRERVVIGERTIVGRGVAIENDCKVGSSCKLETNAYLCAFSTLEDHVFVAPCVVTTNDNYMARSAARFAQFKGVTIKCGGRIGAGATILPGRIIYEDGAVAAGSVVTKDVAARTIVAGVPARFLREVPQEQWLENQ